MWLFVPPLIEPTRWAGVGSYYSLPCAAGAIIWSQSGELLEPLLCFLDHQMWFDVTLSNS